MVLKIESMHAGENESMHAVEKERVCMQRKMLEYVCRENVRVCMLGKCERMHAG